MCWGWLKLGGCEPALVLALLRAGRAMGVGVEGWAGWALLGLQDRRGRCWGCFGAEIQLFASEPSPFVYVAATLCRDQEGGHTEQGGNEKALLSQMVLGRSLLLPCSLRPGAKPHGWSW